MEVMLQVEEYLEITTAKEEAGKKVACRVELITGSCREIWKDLREIHRLTLRPVRIQITEHQKEVAAYEPIPENCFDSSI